MILRSLSLGAVGALILAESAFALSCLSPDLAKIMEEAKASETVYSILVGTLETPPAAQMPLEPFDPEDQFKPKPPVTIPAKFSGYALTSDINTDALLTEFPVDIETSCAGPWCSRAPSSESRNIVFVEMRQNQTPLLKISPCPKWVFPLRDKGDQVEKLRACFDKKCLWDVKEVYRP